VLTALASPEGERFRLVAAEGEHLGRPELPGAPHHEVMNLGRHAAGRVFCQLAGIGFVQV
jgi:hypothetical protein